MPEIDVDIVTLVAIQELSTASTPTADWVLPIGDPAVGNKIANKSTITSLATIISGAIGSAVLVPDRVYVIQPDLSVWVNNTPDPDVVITNDGTGFPRILSDEYLEGKDWSLFRRGTEYMKKGEQWQNDVVDGGFSLKEPGDQFEGGQEYFLIFKPVISNVLVTPDAVARFTVGEAVVTSSTNAISGNDRKLILIQGATSAAIIYTLRAAYPENVLCVIETGGGSNKQTIIAPPVGQTIWRGGVSGRIVLGQVDYIALVRIGTIWRIVSSGDRWKNVGTVVFGGIPVPDRISANGQTLAISDYPGVDDYLTILNATLPGSVISVSAWNAGDRSKWARDATTIKVPDYRGWSPRFLDLGAGKDADRGAIAGAIVGSTQASANKEHNHADTVDNRYNRVLLHDGFGTVQYVDNNDPSGTEPNLLNSREMALSGNPLEARPENVGLPALINI
jgi:hypothetical protein